MITSIVKTFYYLKCCPIFEGSVLCLFTKYDNFLLKCWVLAKNLAYFVSLPVKLVTHISIPPTSSRFYLGTANFLSISVKFGTLPSWIPPAKFYSVSFEKLTFHKSCSVWGYVYSLCLLLLFMFINQKKYRSLMCLTWITIYISS